MIGRRSLLIGLAAAAGGLFLVRDRLPWPPLSPRFADGRGTPWLPIPAGGLIEIEVRVAGRALHAVVDSGAQFSAIDRMLAERLGLPRTFAAPLVAYGVSGGPTLTHTVGLELTLPGLAVAGLRAAALDLAPIAQATGREFQLLIGRDVLGQVVLEADFPLRRARFLAPGVYRAPPDAKTIALEGAMTDVRVEAAAPLRALVDTGASGVLALSEAAARQTGLLAPGRPARPAHSVSLGGLSMNRRVTARTITVGDLTLRNVEVQVYRPAANAPAPAGLLGAGLFSRFRMALDLAGGRLHLTPPSLMIIR